MARGSVRKRSFVKAGKRSSNGLLLGYARVSKGDDQTNIMQARALRATGCRRIFEEAASGGRWDRSELHRLLDYLREGVRIGHRAGRAMPAYLSPIVMRPCPISRTSRSKPSNICVGTVMATIQSPHRSARHCRATAI